ncbi:DUF4136 domain-containing protein [Mucilaginibacter sp. AW1-3]
MKKHILLTILIAAAFASCRKIPNYSDLSSQFVVSTNYARGTAFNTYKTYFIADTVINLGGTGADTILVGAAAQQLVSAVKTNMNARGYTFVARKSKPDLGLRLGVVKVLNIEAYPGWYGGYPGWNPFYWGGYYPYYYPWTTVYAYDTGTIILDTYDLKNAKTNGQYITVWNITAFGALGYDTSTNVSRGINAINQGFEQSQYVKAN